MKRLYFAVFLFLMVNGTHGTELVTETCDVPPPANSTDLERYVWVELCHSGEADISEITGLSCDSIKTYIEDDSVWLSKSFLQSVFTDTAFAEARETPWITISCAAVPEFDLQEREVHGSIRIMNSVVRNTNLNGARISGSLIFHNSHFTSLVSAENLTVKQDVLFEQTNFDGINFYNGEVGGKVQIKASHFTDQFTGSNLKIEKDLIIRDESSFETLNLVDADIGYTFNSRGHNQISLLTASGLKTGSHFILIENKRLGGLNLSGASVGANINLEGSSFSEAIKGDRLKAFGSVFFKNVFASKLINLRNAAIGSNLEFDGGEFMGKIVADGISVENNLMLRDGGTFNQIDLTLAEIGGDLTASRSDFKQDFVAESLLVSGNVHFNNSASVINLNLKDAEIGDRLLLSSSSFSGTLDLSGSSSGLISFYSAQDYSELQCIRISPMWKEGATILLNGARTGTLQAIMSSDSTHDSWQLFDPNSGEFGKYVPMNLDGFNYDHIVSGIGGFGVSGSDANGLINWLEQALSTRSNAYLPHPYTALEKSLRSIGAESMANVVVFERFKYRANARANAEWFTDGMPQWKFPFAWLGHQLTKLYDVLLEFTVGFGVYPERAFYWFFTFVFAGVFLARPCKALCKNGETKASWGDSFFYSLENAIPLMEPSEDYKIKHDNLAVRMFFNAQKIVGFVLATVLIGSMTIGS